MTRLRLLLPLLVVFGGCQCERVQDSPDPGIPNDQAPAPVEATDAPPIEEAADLPAEAQPADAVPAFIEVYMRAIDLDGAPIEGVIPIVTLQPNAFDRPVAIGKPTDENGDARLRAPRDVHLYLRAWDHEQRWFAVNYFDILPGEGDRTDRLQIQMAQSATLSATLTDSDGTPLANESVRLMLIHPTAGPWWPAETMTDPNGRATWENIPPGSYTADLQTQSGLALQRPDTSLPPAGAADVGALALQ